MQEGGCAMSNKSERNCTECDTAKPCRDADEIKWAEPVVWTARMLAALDTGVKGGKWHSLMDKVWAERTLRRAFKDVASNRGSAGVDHQSVVDYASNLDVNIVNLSQELRRGNYRPSAVRRVYIPKPGSRKKRPLGIPTVRDRIVQTAVRMVIEPIFEHDFAEHSYGFRPGRGCKDALRRVDRLLKTGYTWVLDADLQAYFDTINHDILMSLIGEKIADGRLKELIVDFLNQDIMDTASRWHPETGTPQGAVISPLLSNIYLDGLDKLLSISGFEMVRYADDFVVLCKDEESVCHALSIVENEVASMKLSLHPEKTCVVDAGVRGGFDFLGYHFERGLKYPSKKSEKNFRMKVASKTRRCNGHSLERIIHSLHPLIRGWFEYFKHSIPNVFRSYDGYVRMRLRSLLRKRRNGRGRGRGADHQRWPNKFFADNGLYSQVAAHRLNRQSLTR